MSDVPPELSYPGGVRMRCVAPPTAPDFWSAMAAGKWEPQTVAALVALTGPDKTFLDIGGWIGPTAFVAAGRGAQVHSFEPDPKALQLYRLNLDLNPDLAKKVTLHEYAVGRTTGRATLTSGVLGDSTSSFAKRRGERVEVPVRAIQDLAKETWFALADVVKMDVEGAEYELMGEFARFLSHRRPHFLLSTHVDYLSHRSPKSLKWVRRVVTVARLASHPRIVQQLHFYRHWYVPDDGHWRQISRNVAARNLLRYRNQEFLLSDTPLPLSITAH